MNEYCTFLRKAVGRKVVSVFGAETINDPGQFNTFELEFSTGNPLKVTWGHCGLTVYEYFIVADEYTSRHKVVVGIEDQYIVAVDVRGFPVNNGGTEWIRFRTSSNAFAIQCRGGSGAYWEEPCQEFSWTPLL